jgi:type II secretory pathway component PulF
MATFTYVARNDSGQIQRGTLDAATPAALRMTLQSRGLKLAAAEEIKEPISVFEVVSRYLNPLQWIPPRSIHVEVALEQLAVMLRSGVSLLSALQSVEQQAQYAPLKRVIRQISDDVQDGMSLADAFARHHCFREMVIQMTRVGELTGNLDSVLQDSARQLTRSRQNLNSTITALAYPVVVLIAAIGVAIYMVVVVLPELQKVLRAMGRSLPAMTQRLMDIAVWIEVNGLATLVIALSIVAAGVLAYLWPPGRLMVDRISLRIPLVGNVLRLAGTITFASAMRSMLSSGITVLEALRTVERLHSNKYLALRVAAAREAVLAGDGLAPSLSVKHTYTPMLGSMVAVAEDTGQMEEVLERVTIFHEEQLKLAIKRLSAIMEPAIVVVIGFIVGYIYISFFLALFSVSGGVG